MQATDERGRATAISSSPTWARTARATARNGRATGECEDFVTGFVGGAGGEVWGRPAGLMVAGDGSLLMSDDGSGTVWRIAYAR